jgi:hypothetical protein
MLVDNTLYGVYTAQPPVDEKNLDAFVRKHLPYYSVPERWKYVDSIPLTANGKINRVELGAMVLRPNKATHERHDSGTDMEFIAEKNVSIASTLQACLPTTYGADASKDLEKGDIIVTSKSEASDSSGRTSTVEAPDALPPKNSYHGLRWLRHRAFILYRRFFSIVVTTNVAVACCLLYRGIHKHENVIAHLATATAANLCVAVLMRSEPVVNLLFTVFCSVPVSTYRSWIIREPYADRD